MGDQLCVKKILNNHWISGVRILKGLIRLLKGLKFSLVNTETTVKIIWSSEKMLEYLLEVAIDNRLSPAKVRWRQPAVPSELSLVTAS